VDLQRDFKLLRKMHNASGDQEAGDVETGEEEKKSRRADPALRPNFREST
jgi:hypothetical protein